MDCTTWETEGEVIDDQRQNRKWGTAEYGLFSPEQEATGTAPVPGGELALVGSHQQDVVNLVLDAEGVLRGGLILRARVRAHVGVLQPHLGGQAIHGVEGQDLLQEVNGCGEQSGAGRSLVTPCQAESETPQPAAIPGVCIFPFAKQVFSQFLSHSLPLGPVRDSADTNYSSLMSAERPGGWG